MSEVKTFRIRGEIRKRGEKLPFKKEFRAVKKEDAVDALYKDIGSRHKAKRFMISILSIEEAADLVSET